MMSVLLPVLYALLHNAGQVRVREYTALSAREERLLGAAVEQVHTHLGDQTNLAALHVPKWKALLKNTTNLELPSSSAGSKAAERSTSGLPVRLKEKFPHFMIVGFGKAGTRALYDALRLHPQLDGPEKEERFFSNKYDRGLGTYLSSFPTRPLGGFLIEKSPDYILRRQVRRRIVKAAEQVGRNIEDLIFVVVTRNPIDRAMSEYLEWRVQRKVSKSPPLPAFDEMVLNENGVLQTQQPFINASCYEYHIREWLRVFSEHQMCYVDGDAFVTSPLQQMQKLENCMGLEHFFSARNFVFNEKRGFYCFQKDADMQCMGGAKGRPHPPISTEVRTRLTEYFQQCNSHLSQYTGFDISY